MSPPCSSRKALSYSNYYKFHQDVTVYAGSLIKKARLAKA